MYEMCDRCLKQPAQLCLECAEKISQPEEHSHSAELAAEWCERNSWNPDIIPDLAKEIANTCGKNNLESTKSLCVECPEGVNCSGCARFSRYCDKCTNGGG